MYVMKGHVRTRALHGVELTADGGKLVLEADKKLEHHVELLANVAAALGRHRERAPLGAALVESQLLLKGVAHLIHLGRALLELLELRLPST